MFGESTVSVKKLIQIVKKLRLIKRKFKNKWF